MLYKHRFNFEFSVDHELSGENEKEWDVIDKDAIIILKSLLEEIHPDDLTSYLQHVSTSLNKY